MRTTLLPPPAGSRIVWVAGAIDNQTDGLADREPDGPPDDAVEELRRLAKLYRLGVMNDAEYLDAQRRLLEVHPAD